MRLKKAGMKVKRRRWLTCDQKRRINKREINQEFIVLALPSSSPSPDYITFERTINTKKKKVEPQEIIVEEN
uniref:Uncharacterized protein n=1 Tax=Glossina pallidipes TaxID=7398 RepID=A0A1B0AC16_GLOPL